METLLRQPAQRPGRFRGVLANILQGAHEVMRCAACSIHCRMPQQATSSTAPSATGAGRAVASPKGPGHHRPGFETREPVNSGRDPAPRALRAPAGQDCRLRRFDYSTLDGASCRGVMQAMNPLDRAQFSAEDMHIRRLRLAGFRDTGPPPGGRELKCAVQEAERNAELELARQVQVTFLPEPDGARAVAHRSFSTGEDRR